MSKNQLMVALIGEDFVFQVKENVIIIVIPLVRLVVLPRLRVTHRMYAMTLLHDFI